MSKETYDRLAKGTREAIAFVEGSADIRDFVVHIPDDIDLKRIRRKLGMSQPVFAERFGFSVGRVRDWEQGRTEIDAPSRILLRILDREPDAVKRALSDAA
jgi:putative transcriptional regulator